MSMGTYLIAPMVFMFLGVQALGLSFEEYMMRISTEQPVPALQLVLVLVQGVSAVLSFIVVPTLFIWRFQESTLSSYFMNRGLSVPVVLITAGLTLSLMVVNSLLIEWNMHVEFPESLAATFDQMEEQGRIMTAYLTDFYSLPYFLLVMLVVAVVPALGEELLFRGLIQKYFQGIWGNPHVAIWATAVFFSAFHMQFYGFVPRMVLGAFFGYLFYFSGNLWYASIAHFINNGFTLVMMYLFQQRVVAYDIEGAESVSIWPTLVFAIIGGFLFVLFKKQLHITDNLRNE
ncbi:CPBP family intramembrane metalloprotease [Reichenbachiella carrageenanivorans]|uniref:CPBP family intramembrane metalloprotease n=1 Tax=Reichenbachiella carrageenanivorans TaxID=2979869 RepID=A0ABY6D4U3_9BACT|nr:CPBP family intramembrane glutamic endopeptidase [Reichenbachiella carrageenanivorans]UXX80640.1 CPBP family intramembrane metalloprotease [Reichenbachiella carrageenanivorans]